LVGPSKNVYGKMSMILTQTQMDSGSIAIQNSISDEVHGRPVVRILKRMLPTLKGDGRAKNDL
jgi:hypothetical protein